LLLLTVELVLLLLLFSIAVADGCTGVLVLLYSIAVADSCTGVPVVAV
jgi:hypothetical protein